MRCDVDRHLARHHAARLPLRDQRADGVLGPADDGRLRRGDHREHDVVDAARGELREHLLRGQLHRCHGAGTGDRRHQARPTADDLDAVVERQRPGDHGGGDLTHRVADDRSRHHAVGRHRRGQCDLDGEHGGLHAVDAGHGLRRRHRLGDRESGLRRDQRFESLRPWRRTPARWPGGRRPSPPTASPDPRTPTPGRARPWRPRARRAPRRRRPRASAATSSSRVVGHDDGADRPVRASTRQRVGQIRQRRGVVGVGRGPRPSRPGGPRCGAVPRPTWRTAGTAVRRSASVPVCVDGAADLVDGRLLEDGVHVGARDSPYDETAARRGWWPLVGHGVASSGTKRLVSMLAISSGSAVKCRFFGTVACCSDRMAFISPSAPDADWPWPKLVFAEPSAHGPVGAVDGGEAGELDGIADGCAGAVGLDHADGGGVDATGGQGGLVDGRPARPATGWRC